MRTALINIRRLKMKIYTAVNMCAASLFPKMVRLTYIPRRKCIPNESENRDNGHYDYNNN